MARKHEVCRNCRCLAAEEGAKSKADFICTKIKYRIFRVNLLGRCTYFRPALDHQYENDERTVRVRHRHRRQWEPMLRGKKRDEWVITSLGYKVLPRG